MPVVTRLRVASDVERQAAAQARRAGAPGVGYRTRRSAPGPFAPPSGLARAVPFPAQLRATRKEVNGRQLVNIVGHASVVDKPYEMWDEFGPYDEVIDRGAFDVTLAASPDVSFLVNHRGVTMARTTNGTLTLSMDKVGLVSDAWVNPERGDVSDLVIAVDDLNITEMSFAFFLVDGVWADDFRTFRILQTDMNKGDTSAVNYGANPYTDVSARARDLFNDLEHLPAGAARAALVRLSARADMGRPARINLADAFRGCVVPVELLGVDRVERDAPPPATSAHVRRLQARVASTTARMLAEATQRGLGVADLARVRLPWYEIRDADGGPDVDQPATVLIYDEIGGSFGVDSKTFAEELDAITARTIHVRINSPGGSVFDAIAIHSTLLRHPAKVVVYVDALAASAASLVAMAGDEVVMMPGSQMMIHDASAVEDGNAADMAKMSTFLDRQSDNVAEMYRTRGGGETAEWRDLMRAETWMFAAEAVEMGLADRVHETLPAAPAGDVMERTFDLRHFRYAGRGEAPAPKRRTGRSVEEVSESLVIRQTQPTGRSIALVEALLDLN